MNKKHENRIHALEVEAALSDAFDKLGGEDHFAQWARQNPRECRRILARFLPYEALETKDGGITLGDLLGASKGQEG
jgi:hypothetical protein